jgi:uncharacterized protein (DUF1778 family)
MSKYIKSDKTKTEICKIRLTAKQKNSLTRIANNENKTITRVILESLTESKKIAI